MQFKESINSFRGKFLSRDRGQGGAGVTGNEVDRQSSRQFLPNPDPISPALETTAKFVSRELTTADKKYAQNYFLQRCSETESYTNSSDEYWQTICPLLITVNRLIATGRCDMAKQIMEVAIAQAKQELENLDQDLELDPQTKQLVMANQKMIIKSVEYDLKVLDPNHGKISH